MAAVSIVKEDIEIEPDTFVAILSAETLLVSDSKHDLVIRINHGLDEDFHLNTFQGHLPACFMVDRDNNRYFIKRDALLLAR